MKRANTHQRAIRRRKLKNENEQNLNFRTDFFFFHVRTAVAAQRKDIAAGAFMLCGLGCLTMGNCHAKHGFFAFSAILL